MLIQEESYTKLTLFILDSSNKERPPPPSLRYIIITSENSYISVPDIAHHIAFLFFQRLTTSILQLSTPELSSFQDLTARYDQTRRTNENDQIISLVLCKHDVNLLEVHRIFRSSGSGRN